MTDRSVAPGAAGLTPAFSVVIPAYNEESRLPATLGRIAAFLGDRGDLQPAEIIVVDDGSRDATGQVVERFAAPEGLAISLVRLPQNRGKGAAVRAGLAASRGDWVLVTDADLSAPIADVDVLRAAGAPIAFGSRALRRELISEAQPWFRDAMGRCFNLLVRILGLTRMRDTQCGFKLIAGDLARRLAAEMRVDGFAFDLELLARARRRGVRCVEVPVRWGHVEQSRVSPVRHSLEMGRDAVRLRLWLWFSR